jgi:hypothetical protein
MDIENLLKLLSGNAVEYVIIGASAFPVHGYSRSTLDLDIFVRPEKENAQRTLKALEEFGFDVADITVNDILSYKLLIREYLVDVDIHPFVTGITFEEVWRNRLQDEYGDTPAVFASLDDLIKMKEAAGRQKDLDDLKHLYEIRARRDS